MAHALEMDASGHYCVCVFNADTASDEEIIEVFERFGPVVSMNRSNNLAFIRFATFEEASSCLEGMEDHHQFRVKPGKRKPQDRSDNQRNRDRVPDHRRAEMSSLKSGSSNSPPATERQQATPTRTMPALKYDEPEVDAASLVRELCYRVGIAHLPPDMLQCDIYLLCSKAKASALHVDMKSFTRPPQSEVHYAVVYVKNAFEVENIVRSLNNLKVNGFQLIVAQYEVLVEEGKALPKNK